MGKQIPPFIPFLFTAAIFAGLTFTKIPEGIQGDEFQTTLEEAKAELDPLRLNRTNNHEYNVPSASEEVLGVEKASKSKDEQSTEGWLLASSILTPILGVLCFGIATKYPGKITLAIGLKGLQATLDGSGASREEDSSSDSKE